MTKRTIEERMAKCQSPLLRKLFGIMLEKKTNLCVAADLGDTASILKLAEEVGPHICLLKIHSENVGEVKKSDLSQLNELKKKFNFLLFEDRKFFDGGKVVEQCYKNTYSDYVDLVTVFPNGGDAIFQAIRDGSKHVDEPRGCLAVCELSFIGVIQPDAAKLLEVAERNRPTCVGIVAQSLNVSDDSSMIKLSPGVHLNRAGDDHNQQWRAPEEVMSSGTDVIIVGRGITEASRGQWGNLAKEYKELAWSVYVAPNKD